MKKLKKDPTLKASSMETMDNPLLDIFSRLPAESIFECRRVCKTWRALTYHPCFAKIHARRQLLNLHNATATQVGFITFLYTKVKRKNKSILYYGKYDDENNVSYNKTLTRVNHRRFRDICGIVGSCNGLICLSLRRLGLGNEDPIYVCNPITRECIYLPKFKDVKAGSGKICLVSGFGYSLSTNEYKVVRIYYHGVRTTLNSDDHVDVGDVQVYTLGSGTGWRNVEKTSHFLVRISSHPGVFANGALHWLEEREGKIVAFDLADEKFRVLPSPPCLRLQRNMRAYELMELGGCLCLFHKVYPNGIRSKTMWTFKKIKSSYYNDRDNEEEYESWTWTEEISFIDIPPGFETLAFTENGKVLLCFDGNFLCRYEPKTAALEKLWDFGEDNMHCGTITHINSFVSLKSLGEDPMIIESIET